MGLDCSHDAPRPPLAKRWTSIEAMTARCARCNRPVLNPVMLGEKGYERGYGPVCAGKVAPERYGPSAKPKRVRLFTVSRKQQTKAEEAQMDLLDEQSMAHCA
jgi:hypothetical protein